MLKQWLLPASAVFMMGACQSGGVQESEQVGMANPASEYCVKQGGRLEPRKDAQGNEYAICHLPDGTAVEEWELFRKNN